MYLAGQAAGWFILANESEAVAFPRFEYHYHQLCQRVMHGEDISLPVAEALPEKTSKPLDADERRARLAQLRKELDL